MIDAVSQSRQTAANIRTQPATARVDHEQPAIPLAAPSRVVQPAETAPAPSSSSTVNPFERARAALAPDSTNAYEQASGAPLARTVDAVNPAQLQVLAPTPTPVAPSPLPPLSWTMPPLEPSRPVTAAAVPNPPGTVEDPRSDPPVDLLGDIKNALSALRHLSSTQGDHFENELGLILDWDGPEE